jgi:hypothetical protein
VQSGQVFNWLAAEHGAGASPEALAQLFAGWEVVYLLDGGQRTGAALLNGTEIHFIVAPEWRRRAIRRDNARAFLAPLLARSGYLTTRVLHGALASLQFVRRMGFEQTWSDASFHYFALCKLPFTRSPNG